MYYTPPHITIIEDNSNFFLKDELKSKIYEINELISGMIVFFNSPNLLDNYIEDLSFKLKEEKLKVAEIVTPFFNKMIVLGFIVESNNYRNETVIEQIVPDFCIDKKYIVSKILRNKNNTEYVLVVNERRNLSSKKLLKIILKDDNKYNKKRKNLNSEFNINKKLAEENYNISKPIFFVDGIDYCYSVSEYYENSQTIQEFVKSNLGNIDFSLKVKVLSKIIETFSFIHSSNILHGDIHYGNILITNDYSIKVIDFEFSNDLYLPEKKIKKGGMQYFIPPERLGNNSFNKILEISTIYGEIYQVGLLIYYIFFEKLPFNPEKWSDLRNSIRLGVEIPTENPVIHDFLSKCLALKPENRFPSLEEMLLDWEKVIPFAKL
jgi:serine/threonine protein kinase